MRIAFYTIDLFCGREHLMPWRTVLEVAVRLLHAGHEVCVLNSRTDISVSSSNDENDWNGVRILTIGSGCNALVNIVNSLQFDILYIQATWRDGLKNLNSLKDIPFKKNVYFSGGVYDIDSAFKLAKEWGWNIAKPYILESLVPKRLLVRKMRKAGITNAIGFTPYTTKICQKAGFAESVCIQTGKDDFENVVADECILEKYNLKGKKWMLFSGAPAPTRGACELLKAIDKTNEKDLRVVLLMRTDVNSDYRCFNEIYERMSQKEKVIIIREKISRPQLRAFFGGAYYGLLPFIVIPSEIPVTYLELFSCGTPVITFNNGGTTSFLKDGLIISEKDVKSLAATLDEAWMADTVRKIKSDNALAFMKDYPNWDDVTKKWLLTAM